MIFLSGLVWKAHSLFGVVGRTLVYNLYRLLLGALVTGLEQRWQVELDDTLTLRTE